MTNTTARTSSVPRRYVVTSPPTGAATVDDLMLYIVSELRHIQQATDTFTLMIPQVAVAEPAHKLEGMIRFARSPWRPVSGQTGDGWVQWISKAWAKFTPSTP